MVENITGFGMDVPMLGIREATRALRAEPIALFEDGVYAASNLFQISTSQVRIAKDQRMTTQQRNSRIVFNGQSLTCDDILHDYNL